MPFTNFSASNKLFKLDLKFQKICKAHELDYNFGYLAVLKLDTTIYIEKLGSNIIN